MAVSRNNNYDWGEFENPVYRRHAEIRLRHSSPPVIAPLVGEPLTMGPAMDPRIWSELQHFIDMEKKIFSKLPFREFFQARAVCKEWNRLASDPEFLRENAKPVIRKPYFCLKHPRGDWQIILMYNEVANEWRQVPMLLPNKKGYPANCVDGFYHLSYPEKNPEIEFPMNGKNIVIKNIVINLQTRMQHILPPSFIQDGTYRYDSVYSLAVDEACEDRSFQVVSAVDSSEHDARKTTVYYSKTDTWKESVAEPHDKFTRHQVGISACCRNILYTYCSEWRCIVVYDMEMSAWGELDVPLDAKGCHLGVWKDSVYAVVPNVSEEYRCVSVHVLTEESGLWEEVARIPADLGRHMFCMVDLNVDWIIAAQFQRLFLDKIVEACFCEKYVQITVFLQDYHVVIDEKGDSFWVPGGWVPRRFCLHNLETGEWRIMDLPFSTCGEIKIETV